MPIAYTFLARAERQFVEPVTALLVHRGAVREAITYNGPVRLYFDPSEMSDAKWCVAGVESHWHIHVRAVSIDGVHLRAVYSPNSDERPLCTSAWLEGRANVSITDDGRAYLRPEGALS